MIPDPPVVVMGFGRTGRAVAAALARRGIDVVAVDDRPDPEAQRHAADLGIALIEAPEVDELEQTLRDAGCLVPTPGLPERHPALAKARAAGLPVLSELDLAAAWDDRPLVAITGTDGKTTVTTMVTQMLAASGRRTVAAGNTDVPLVEAIEDPEVEVFVVEASSFRLGTTRSFRPRVATWLNFGADHLDVHTSIASYEAAKAVIFRDLGPGSVAVANAADPVVMRHLPRRAPTVTFGTPTSPYRVLDGVLVGEDGPLVPVAKLWRRFPHDVANALAAAATAHHAGAGAEAIRQVLGNFGGLPHRMAAVGCFDGIEWYDDSKATTPHASAAALAGFERVVLIAGGQNKGLAFDEFAARATQVVALVAIGDDGAEVARAFEGRCPVASASSMDAAVAAARDLARPGDVVVLSPGCASFDWYAGYADRGDDFVRAVRSLHRETAR